jgi:hypothetical protein
MHIFLGGFRIVKIREITAIFLLILCAIQPALAEYNIPEKLVFLEKGGKIIWVRQIAMNETIPFKPWGPLDDFHLAYPSAKNNATINSFIESYSPEEWDGKQIDRTSSYVYLMAENGSFRELRFRVDNGNITQVRLFDESDVPVNRTEALKIASKELNSTATSRDVRVLFGNSEPFWAVSYMDGLTFRTLLISSDSGEQDYSGARNEEQTGSFGLTVNRNETTEKAETEKDPAVIPVLRVLQSSSL